MKTIIIYCLFSFLLCTASSCQKEDGPTQQDCASTSKIVKTVTDVEGMVHFIETTQQYMIFAHQPGTIDVVDIGVVCGKLPSDMQVEGIKIIFSGIYKEYNQSVESVAGYTYYYLEISKADIIR